MKHEELLNSLKCDLGVVRSSYPTHSSKYSGSQYGRSSSPFCCIMRNFVLINACLETVRYESARMISFHGGEIRSVMLYKLPVKYKFASFWHYSYTTACCLFSKQVELNETWCETNFRSLCKCVVHTGYVNVCLIGKCSATLFTFQGHV